MTTKSLPRVVILAPLFTTSIAAAQHVAVMSPYFGWGTYSVRSRTPFAMFGNQAMLASLQASSVGVLAERPFLADGLSRGAVAAVMKTSSGGFGLIITFEGSPGYQRLGGGLAYGRMLGKVVAIGVQFDYTRVAVTGYTPVQSPGVQVALGLNLNPRLKAGWQVQMPIKMTENGTAKESDPGVTAGLGYDLNKQWSAGLLIQKNPGLAAGFIIGLTCEVTTSLQIKAGFSSGTIPAWFGIGYRLGRLQINLTSSFHPILGVTPATGLIFCKTE